MSDYKKKTCPICEHPDRKFIESDLFDGGPGNSFDDLCKRYRVTSAKLLIHKEQHMVDCSQELVKLVTEEYDKKMQKTGVQKALTSLEVLDLVIARAPGLLDKVTMNDILRALKLKAEMLGTITNKTEVKLDWLKDIPDGDKK